MSVFSTIKFYSIVCSPSFSITCRHLPGSLFCQIPQVFVWKKFSTNPWIWLRLEKISSSNCFSVIEKGFNRSVRGQVNMTFELEQTNRVPIFFPVLFLLYTFLARRERKQHFFNPLNAVPLQYKNYGMLASSNLILSCYLWLVARMIYSSLQLINKNINYLWLYSIV